jgi:hypothetical protein
MIDLKPAPTVVAVNCQRWSFLIAACFGIAVCACTGDDRAADAGADAAVCQDRDQDWWCLPEDCDDSDSAINPGIEEQAANGLDDDCDDLTDEAE